MGTTGDEEWAPKTRDDWTGLFKDAFLGAMESDRSKQEEIAAKTAAEEAAKATEGSSGDDAIGEGGNGGAPKRGFAERLLGI
jgi:hypothetical protein